MKLFGEQRHPPPPARGCLVIDGVSALVKCPVSSHFPGSPQAPALCLITSKGLDTDNPGLGADGGKSAEDQALGEVSLGTQPGPGTSRAAHTSLGLFTRHKPGLSMGEGGQEVSLARCQRSWGSLRAAPGPLSCPLLPPLPVRPHPSPTGTKAVMGTNGISTSFFQNLAGDTITTVPYSDVGPLAVLQHHRLASCHPHNYLWKVRERPTSQMGK